MIRQLGVLLVVATYTSVTSALPPCVCTREMKPVCGSDGVTYSNMCRLRCQQESHPSLQLRSEGACPGDDSFNIRPCICTDEYDPVCASDGRTYPNKCAMDCEKGNLEVVHNGECVKEKAAVRACFCPYNYAPVCGTDGKTYGNECSLKCEEGVEVAHSGECRNKRDTCLFCPANYAPLCGTDGKTYANDCDLNCNGEGAEVAYQGECRAKRATQQYCPLILSPVCGTNGKTYPNECVLDNSGDNTRLAHHGSCKKNRQAHPCSSCMHTMEPVCGSNGRTYNNLCSLECEGGTVQLVYQGECRDKREAVEYAPPACFCTYEMDPVCGTNGHTYSNLCSLECEGGKVQLAYHGECRDKREAVKIASLPACLCTREANPVCGTDGKTYPNACMLNCVREQNENLHIDYPGPCRDELIIREVIPDQYPTCTCPKIMQPVCASNGRSYNSECEMRCAGEDLTVEKYGRCGN